MPMLEHLPPRRLHYRVQSWLVDSNIFIFFSVWEDPNWLMFCWGLKPPTKPTRKILVNELMSGIQISSCDIDQPFQLKVPWCCRRPWIWNFRCRMAWCMPSLRAGQCLGSELVTYGILWWSLMWLHFTKVAQVQPISDTFHERPWLLRDFNILQELHSGISILCLFFLAQVVIDISISDWHLTSKEIYAGNSLQAIVGLLCELEQQTITQLKNKRRRLPLKNKHQWMNETRKLWFTEWPEKVLTIGSQ